VQCEACLAVHDLVPVEPDFRRAQPEGGIAELHREGRQRFQIFLIDEGELGLVHRVAAETEAERVKDRVLLGVLVLDIGDVEGEQLGVVEGL
jgi:hypothetical protein